MSRKWNGNRMPWLLMLALASASCTEEVDSAASPPPEIDGSTGDSAEFDSSEVEADAAQPDAANPVDASDSTGPSDASDASVPQDASDIAGPGDVDEPVDGDGGVDSSEPDGGESDATDATDATDGDSGEPDGGGGEPPTNACLEPGEGPGFKVASRARLRWKRVVALQRDLLNWLQLTPQEICGELGINGICFSIAHLVPLGGNDPIYAAMYEPIPQPGVTSILSTERVTLSACGRRADLDFKAATKGGEPAVFTQLDFGSESVAADNPEIAEQIQDLMRLMLAREATESEVNALKELAAPLEDFGPVSPRDFAKTACFAIATTSEALLH